MKMGNSGWGNVLKAGKKVGNIEKGLVSIDLVNKKIVLKGFFVEGQRIFRISAMYNRWNLVKMGNTGWGTF